MSSGGGNPDTGEAIDPIGSAGACATLPAERAKGTAIVQRRFRRPFTMLGMPTVQARIRTRGRGGFIAARLWDVHRGRQLLVSRGVYRLRDNQRGEILFQLFGNGWRFARGHTAKLELLGNDPNFLRTSNFDFSVRISKLRVRPTWPVTEERASVGEVELVYESIGDPGDPALLLVMGLGMQLINWDLEFCEGLAERGFHVIRFDNRDAGLSTKIDAPVPNVMRAMAGFPIRAPYLLDDMAGDSFGLLDHLGIERAHVVGVSMGGMIAQTMAIRAAGAGALARLDAVHARATGASARRSCACGAS